MLRNKRLHGFASWAPGRATERSPPPYHSETPFRIAVPAARIQGLMAPMENITFDESRLPLVVVTFRGTATSAEFEEYLRRLSANLDRKQPTAIVIDSREFLVMPAAQRKRQAEWIDATRTVRTRYTLGTAFVINSPLMRGALTAIFWLTKYDTPYVVVATPEEAEAWALKLLSDAGSSGE